MADSVGHLISNAHAQMALGALGKAIHDRYVDAGSKGESQYPPDGIPEPPELLALWDAAVRETREQAEAEYGYAAAHGPLYVVTTGAPGPGAMALLEEVLRNEQARLPEEVVNRLRDALREALEGHICEFVELEDIEGKSHGADVDVMWDGHPKAEGLRRLGPFLAPRLIDPAGEEVERRMLAYPQVTRAALTALLTDVLYSDPSTDEAAVEKALATLGLGEFDQAAVVDEPPGPPTPPKPAEHRPVG